MISRRAEELDFSEIVEIVGRPDPFILEIGANNGHSTRAFLGEFADITMHCFEPDHRAIAKWRGFIKDPRATLHEMAIGAETGTATFNMSDGREDEYEGGYYGSGSLRPPKSTGHAWLRFDRTVEVTVNRLDDWTATNVPGREIDFIWADVQGAEVDLINGGREALRRTRWFYTEYSDREGYVGQIPLTKIVELLSDDFEVECAFSGDVLLRNKRLVPQSPGLAARGTQGAERVMTVTDGYTYRYGSDGVFIKVPKDHTRREGKDGRLVAIPLGWTYRQGTDGRIVPIPPGCSIRQGSDGRIVPIEAGASPREGADGRLIGVRPGERTVENESGRLCVVATP